MTAIYLASRWRNLAQPTVLAHLMADGIHLTVESLLKEIVG